MTAAAEALRISGLHAPIVRKIAFMKLHLHRGVIFFFHFQCSLSHVALFYHNGRSSSARFIIHNFICCRLLLLIFSLKLFRNTSPQARFVPHSTRETDSEAIMPGRALRFALVTHMQISQTHIPDASTEITVMSQSA